MSECTSFVCYHFLIMFTCGCRKMHSKKSKKKMTKERNKSVQMQKTILSNVCMCSAKGKWKQVIESKGQRELVREKKSKHRMTLTAFVRSKNAMHTLPAAIFRRCGRPLMLYIPSFTTHKLLCCLFVCRIVQHLYSWMLKCTDFNTLRTHTHTSVGQYEFLASVKVTFFGANPKLQTSNANTEQVWWLSDHHHHHHFVFALKKSYKCSTLHGLIRTMHRNIRYK